MKHLKHIISGIALLCSIAAASAQNKVAEGIEADKTVHNFGDILLDSGPVACTFTLKNTGSRPMVIYNVTTTCGCTEAEWTREPVKPGSTAEISVSYTNNEGPYPFDKTITVYASDAKPILLKIRGICREKELPLTERYPVAFGPLGMTDTSLQCGNLEQGGSKSEAVIVANTSGTPVKVEFKDVSANLDISVTPNPIPAGSTAELDFTVTAERGIWGKNTYWATPVIDGRTYTTSEGRTRIGVKAFTKENFDSMSESERAAGPMPRFENSTYSFNRIKKGEKIHAEFTLTNSGKSPFCVYKLDTDACCYSHSDIPVAAPGEKVTFRVHVDTENMPKGETLVLVTLTTNSPLRPIVNLFIAGWID